MKPLFRYLAVVLLFFLFALLVFRVGWGKDEVFSGSDTNIGLVAQSHRLLPEYFSGAFSSTPLFGNATKVPFSMQKVGQWLCSPALFSDAWYGLYLILSSIALIAYLRIFKLRWVSCALGALTAFWMGSITISASGHLAKLGVMMLFSTGLWVAEKAVRSRSLWKQILWASGLGLVVGFMLLEQQDVGLLAGLFLGPYLLFRLVQTQVSWTRWIAILLPVALLGMGLATPTALQSYAVNVTEAGMQSDPDEKWDFITQWSMVPRELPDLIAPGYMGWKTNDPEGPYWGAVGQSAQWETTRQGFQNFRLDSLYIGIIPILLAFFGMGWAVKNRKKEGGAIALFWSFAAFFALALALGKYSVFYKMFYQLPLVGNIRAPIKFFHNFQVIIGVLSAFGINAALASVKKERETPWRWVWAIVSGVGLLFVLIALSSSGNSFEKDFSEWGQHAPIIVKNIANAWWHAAGLAGLLGGVLWAIRKWTAQAPWIALVLPFVIAGDSLFITSKYFHSVNIAGLRRGNVVVNYLKENQENERIYFVDQQGIYNNWLGMEVPYHGLNVFNIWQMPRMPQEYKDFLSAGNRNPVRLWQLSSVKYLTAPAGVVAQLPQAKPIFYYRFVREGDGVGVQQLTQPQAAQDQVLLELTNALPRFALFDQWEVLPRDQQLSRLFSPEFNPLKAVVVDAQDVPLISTNTRGGYPPVKPMLTPNRATLNTQSSQPSILLFTQRYQSCWSVAIDGIPATLLRCNYLCLGVEVPAGEHQVVFSFSKK